MPDGQREWQAPCKDAVLRPKRLVIRVTALDEVTLIAPPGESATFTLDQVEPVLTALAEARREGVRGNGRKGAT